MLAQQHFITHIDIAASSVSLEIFFSFLNLFYFLQK
jgi:hypothetical protein